MHPDVRKFLMIFFGGPLLLLVLLALIGGTVTGLAWLWAQGWIGRVMVAVLLWGGLSLIMTLMPDDGRGVR